VLALTGLVLLVTGGAYGVSWLVPVARSPLASVLFTGGIHGEYHSISTLSSYYGDE
jgi:hypothetical protein